MNRTALIDWFLILAIGIAWGASFLFIKVAAPAVGPISLVFYRLLIASIILVPFFIKKEHIKNFKKDWKPIIFLAFFDIFSIFYCC